ncbi:MFS transporter [Peribacillus loiseleuriae]|uniref:MFS transporter permease n=1 Tax=Peribacillus loiseleuriae TaxID=1679170 RepID=A0A0K9GWC3_9BACI|nr:MFS transporter [Peribacillus loiseleuriae]KMY50955.1 MFS transporter permease [Peribacillus loiseleuriae]
MKAGKEKLWTRQYITIVLSTLILFIGFYMLTAGFSIHITEISKNPALAGSMTTAFMIASLVTRFASGILIQKLNMKVLLLISLVYFMGTIGLSFLNDSIGYLLFIRVLQGVGFSITTVLLFTLSSSLVPSSRLGEGLVFFAMATSIGLTVGNMLAIFLLGRFSFNMLLLVIFTLVLLSFVGSLFIKKIKKEKPVKKKTSSEPFYKYMFDRRVFLPSIIVSLNYMAIAGTVNFMGALGKETHIGGSISQFFTVQAITMIIVRIFSGKIFDRFGHKILMIPATISGAIGLILLGISHHIGLVLVSGFFFGVAYAVIQPTIQALALSLVPQEKNATANSMLLIFMDLGMAVGSIGLGSIVGFVGYGMTFSYSAIFMILILIIYLIGNRKWGASNIK